MSDLICYCFGYTAQDILKDLKLNGRSLILRRSWGKKGGEGVTAPTRTRSAGDACPMFTSW